MTMKPAPTLAIARTPFTNQDGTLTWTSLKQLQDWSTQLFNGLDAQGNLIGNLQKQVQIIGKAGTLGSITQYLDANGVVTADGIDFSRAYINKDTDHITDGTGSPLAGGKIAFLALSNPLTGKILEWDGANWQWVARAQTKASVSHKWLASYDLSTGLFTQTQPAFTDISGVATTAQIGTGTPLAGEYVDGGTGAWTAIPTAGNLAVNPQTISYIALPADQVIQMNAAGATSVTLPVAGISTGKLYWVKNIGAGICTAQAASGNIDSHATIAITQWQAYQFYWDGSTWHQLSQSLSV